MTREDRILKYREFCLAQPDLPVFYQPWYLDAVSIPGSWDVVMTGKKNEILAAMPFHIRKKWGLTAHLMPKLCKYGGPFITEKGRQGSPHKLCRKLIEKLPRSQASILLLHPDMPYGLPFLWAGFRLEIQYTYQLDSILDLEGTFNGLSRDYRNTKIGKAREVVEVSTSDDVEAFYQVNTLSFSRQNMRPPYSLDFVQGLDQALAEHNARTIFFARDGDGRIHSALYLIHDNISSYLLMAGDDPKLRNSGAGIYLVWKAIEYSSKQLGLNKFDFLGSMIPGVARVRRQFGAQPISYLKASRFSGLRGKIIKHSLHLSKKA